MKGPNDTVTISSRLAFQLLVELEAMAFEIDNGVGDMPECYYQLRAAFPMSNPNDDLIDIERD